MFLYLDACVCTYADVVCIILRVVVSIHIDIIISVVFRCKPVFGFVLYCVILLSIFILSTLFTGECD